MAEGSDLLIFDGTYADTAYADPIAQHIIPYKLGVQVAQEVGVHQLVLFHHNPCHDDDQLDDLGREVAIALPQYAHCPRKFDPPVGVKRLTFPFMPQLPYSLHQLPLQDYDGFSLTFCSDNDCPLTWQEVLQGWQHSPDFPVFFSTALEAVPYAAYFWETPPLTPSQRHAPFTCVVINSPALARVRADYAPFAPYLKPSPQSSAMRVFSNLGGDAQLIAPCPVGPQPDYPHLAAFFETNSTCPQGRPVGYPGADRLRPLKTPARPASLGQHLGVGGILAPCTVRSGAQVLPICTLHNSLNHRFDAAGGIQVSRAITPEPLPLTRCLTNLQLNDGMAAVVV